MRTRCPSSLIRRLELPVCLVLASTVASAQKPQRPPGKLSEKKILPANGSARSVEASDHRLSNTPADDYLIGPEDVLAINVWREPEISRTLPVRPDGKISLPLIGDLQASGLTPEKLRSVVAEKLKAYISSAEVSVMVQEVKNQSFNIVGQVLRPGSYPLTKPVTVLDAIALAGGFQEFANVSKIYVLRRMADGSRETLPFNYKAVIKGRTFDQNVELKPSDTIVVP